MNIEFRIDDSDSIVFAFAELGGERVGSARMYYEKVSVLVDGKPTEVLSGAVKNVSVEDDYVGWKDSNGQTVVIDWILVSMLVDANRARKESSAGCIDLREYQPKRKIYEALRAASP